LLNFQPAGVGVPRHIPQIGDLIGRHRIGTGLQQGIECIVDQVESILLSSCFSMAVLLTNPHRSFGRPTVRYQAMRKSSLAMLAAIRRASSLVSSLAFREPGDVRNQYPSH
jgi:hypothetical protein